MRFEKAVDIDAPAQRVWEVLSDLEGWPRRIGTVESVELLTPPPVTKGSRVRLKETKLPEGTWDVTDWDPPTYFEFRQESRGMTSVVGHRVETIVDERSRLTLRLDMRGLLIPIVALFSRGMTDRHLTGEAEDIKQASETPDR